MTHIGPAVGFSKRYPTQHPGRIQVPCPEYSGGPENCHAAPRASVVSSGGARNSFATAVASAKAGVRV